MNYKDLELTSRELASLQVAGRPVGITPYTVTAANAATKKAVEWCIADLRETSAICHHNWEFETENKLARITNDWQRALDAVEAEAEA